MLFVRWSGNVDGR